MLHSVIFLLSIGWAMVYSSFLVAGNSSGGGGNVVACFDKDGTTIRSTELFDFFEARVKTPGINIDLGEEGLDYAKKVQLALLRLAKIDPGLSVKLQKNFSFFESNHSLIDANLVEVKDLDSDVRPEPGCKIIQTAKQKEPELPHQRYFMIVKKIWNLLDNNNKAGLVLHEILYQYLRENFDHKTSYQARYFTALVASKEALSGLSTKKYFSLLESLKMTPLRFVYANLSFPVSSLVFDENGNVIEGKLESEQRVKLRETDAVPALIRGKISFYPGGRIKRFRLVERVSLNLNGQDTTWEIGEYQLFESGLVESLGNLGEGRRGRIRYKLLGNGGCIIGNSTTYPLAEFYPTGQVKQITFESDEIIRMPIGENELEIGYGQAPDLLTHGQYTFSMEGKIKSIRASRIKVITAKGEYTGHKITLSSQETVLKIQMLSHIKWGNAACESSASLASMHEDGVTLYPNGNPLSVLSQVEMSDPDIIRSIRLINCIQSRKVEFVEYYTKAPGLFSDFRWDFHSTGVIKKGMLFNDTTLECQNGSKKLFQKETVVHLNADGTAICE